LGILTGDVLIIAHLRLSTLTQYLIWFGKPPTSTGEVICLYRERTRFTTIEEDDHPLFATLNLTLVSLCSATMAATTCCPWQPTLIFLKSFSALSLSQHALQIMPLFIGNNGRQEAINHGTNGGTTLASTKHSSGVLPQNSNFLTKNW